MYNFYKKISDLEEYGLTIKPSYLQPNEYSKFLKVLSHYKLYKWLLLVYCYYQVASIIMFEEKAASSSVICNWLFFGASTTAVNSTTYVTVIMYCRKYGILN